MSIIYDPKKMLSKIAPAKRLENAIKSDLSLKKTALSFASNFDFLDRKDINRVALKTLKGYKERVKNDTATKSELRADPAQFVQRVQNEVVFQISAEIKDTYRGEEYEWLPSDAEEPDPEHQLNYGKVFVVGDGEQPGERPGCRCGMRILVKESTLQLGG